MKLLLQVVAFLALISWPRIFMWSPMSVAAPGATNRPGKVLGIILKLAYPLPIGVLFYYLDWGLLWMEPKTFLILTGLIASVGAAFYGFSLFNIARGVSNSGYTINPRGVYYSGSKIKNADPNTFEMMSEDTFELYARDKNHVYRAGVMLPGADPASFRFLGDDSPYSRDDNNVYCSAQLVRGADVATFEPLMFEGAPTSYWRDKNHVYVMGQPIPSADAATFEALTVHHARHSFARDKNHVYEYDKIIDGADAASFVLLNDRISKDKSRIYRVGEAILPMANVTDFRLIDQETLAADAQRVHFIPHQAAAITLDQADPGSFVVLDRLYAKDSSTVYCRSGEEITPVVDADPGTFVVLDGRYAKDAATVYCHSAGKATPIVDADPKTFVVLDGSYSKDASRVYSHFGKVTPIIDADPATFVVLDGRYAKDSSRVYYQLIDEAKPIVDADPETFVVLDWDSDTPDAMDRHRKYKDGNVFVSPGEDQQTHAA